MGKALQQSYTRALHVSNRQHHLCLLGSCTLSILQYIKTWRFKPECTTSHA